MAKKPSPGSVFDKPHPPSVPAPDIEPNIVIEVARAMRAEPELWQIFVDTPPSDWISKADSQRIYDFVSTYLKRHYAEPKRVGGQPTLLLRKLVEGRIADLDDTEAVMAELLKFGGKLH